MRASLHAELVLQALLAAVWSRKPKPGLMLHSDQGTQYTSHDWQSFLKDHGIVCSMSRRGNCHDNAVIESFHQLIKRERIRRKIYATRAAARSDVFDYIELFYNPKRRRGSAGARSPVEFERQTGLSGRSVSTKSGAIQYAVMSGVSTDIRKMEKVGSEASPRNQKSPSFMMRHNVRCSSGTTAPTGGKSRP